MKENLKGFLTFRQILCLFNMEKKTFLKNFTFDHFFKKPLQLIHFIPKMPQ